MMNEEVMRVLTAAVGAQEEHPVVPKVRVRVRKGLGLEMWCPVPDGGEAQEERWAGVTLEEVREALELRARVLALEKADPYHHGYEPPMWAEVDWVVCELRANLPGVVLELYVLGGNRAAKTEFCAKRQVEMLVENAGWYVWGLHSDEASSQSIQQSRIWRYLPGEIKPEETGKYKRGVVAKMSYNGLTGFTQNGYALHNGSMQKFKFYSADVKAVEGAELDGAWSDELIPLDWVNAMEFRLLTRAGKTRATAKWCREVLRARERGEVERVPGELRRRLYQGVHLISFTAVQGYTATVARACDDAVTRKSERAELLPIRDEHGEVCGHEEVPRVQWSAGGKRGVVYLHTKDNRHGGNWEGMKASLEGAPREKILMRAYGVPTRAFEARFPQFTEATHVRRMDRLPGGTWWHLVDPCNGRNYFMVWILVNELGQAVVAREWPQPGDYVPGVGDMGEWAVPGTGNRKDGDRGPAQEPLGWGVADYKEEIARIEKELWRRQHPEADPVANKGGRIKVPDGCRIMDSRAGNTPSLAHGAAETLIGLFEDTAGGREESLVFYPAGRASGAAAGTTGIDESVDLVNDLLSYDGQRREVLGDGTVVFRGRAPRLYVEARCRNVIHALRSWTGADGLKGACKDPVDVLRYFAMSDPLEAGARGEREAGGGGTF